MTPFSVPHLQHDAMPKATFCSPSPEVARSLRTLLCICTVAIILQYLKCPPLMVHVQGLTKSSSQVCRFSGCCTADSQADEDQNKLINNLKIARGFRQSLTLSMSHVQKFFWRGGFISCILGTENNIKCVIQQFVLAQFPNETRAQKTA